ncbi:hypothetical protein [Streptomyces boninensis]|uniref:hypothetical protein n=1 Tax=Streptomyces boninensis TaxID=2039455 RepID=UPI003B21E118
MPEALLITGTVGAGKTSVADAAGDLLTGAGVPHAVMDLDWLCRAWLRPEDDPFNFELLLRNLTCVTRNYVAAGADRLLLAGVVESVADRDRYREALGMDLRVCRLRVALPEVRRRLRDRHQDDPDGLRWHLDRSGELDAILERAGVADFTVDVTSESVPEVAARVLTAAGYA